MLVTTLILLISTGLLLFYPQAVCEKILRRPFAKDYFQAVVSANGLEYHLLRKAIEDSGGLVEYSALKMRLRCDFLVLKHLLKNATNLSQRYTCEERLLILYFQIMVHNPHYAAQVGTARKYSRYEADGYLAPLCECRRGTRR